MGAKFWTASELEVLAREWKNGKHIRLWADMIPNRSELSIQQKGTQLYGKRGRTYDAGNSMSWRAIQRVLSDGKLRTALELSFETGLDRSAIFRELKAHHPEFVHIGGYTERTGSGNRAVLWAYGQGKDARKPKPLSRKVMAKTHWEKMRKERIDAWDRRVAMRKLRADEKSGKLIRRDEAASWI